MLIFSLFGVYVVVVSVRLFNLHLTSQWMRNGKRLAHLQLELGPEVPFASSKRLKSILIGIELLSKRGQLDNAQLLVVGSTLKAAGWTPLTSTYKEISTYDETLSSLICSLEFEILADVYDVKCHIRDLESSLSKRLDEAENAINHQLSRSKGKLSSLDVETNIASIHGEIERYLLYLDINLTEYTKLAERLHKVNAHLSRLSPDSIRKLFLSIKTRSVIEDFTSRYASIAQEIGLSGGSHLKIPIRIGRLLISTQSPNFTSLLTLTESTSSEFESEP